MNADFIKLRWQSPSSSPTSMTIRFEEAVFAQGPGQLHFSDASSLEERSTELFGSKARAAHQRLSAERI